MQVIVYLQDHGVAAVIYPAKEALERYGVHAIARKDVPAGKPFAIIDAADIPSDRTERAGWTVDPAQLTDGVGAPGSSFEQGV